MSNQKAIAQKLGVSQSTVSRALRHDPQVPEGTRKRILAAAAELHYRPNPMVSSLMEQIRTGRHKQARGCLMIIVDRVDKTDWFRYETYREQYEGFTRCAEEHGYTTECLFLRNHGLDAAKVDRILHQRGIDGIFLAAPNWQEDAAFTLTWDRYACATLGYSWGHLPIDRVATSHRRNANRCYSELTRRGYQRIGMIIDIIATDWADRTWIAASALHQTTTTRHNAIPNFVVNQVEDQREAFRQWYTRWQPTAVVCAGDGDSKWLDRMGLLPNSVPRVLCNRPPGSPYAGMDENNRAVGAALCDLLVAKITQNRRGLSQHPQTVLIEGRWCNSALLPTRAPEAVLDLQAAMAEKNTAESPMS